MVRRAAAICAAFLSILIARPAGAAIAIDVTVFKDLSAPGTTLTTPVFSTSASNELLLAFVATDALGGANTTVQSVSGGGLAWALVVRTNAQSGTSEIWRAFAPSPLANAAITAATSQSVVSSLVVMSFTGVDTSGTYGSGAIGATASASSTSGAPNGSLMSTRPGSWVFGVGNDYDNAAARTPASGQTLVHQDLAPIGDTYWVQRQNSATLTAPSAVSISDTAPAADRYNLSLCEILPAAFSSPPWSISGSVGPGTAGSGANVTLAGALLTTFADGSGNYTIAGVPNGTYLVTVQKAGYTFSPPNQTVTVNGANVTGLNFTAQSTLGSISGTVSPASDGAGTTVFYGETGQAIADGSGRYTLANVPNGTFTVIATKTGYSFTPRSQQVTMTSGAAVTGINFTAVSTTAPSQIGQWSAPFDLGLVAVNMVMLHTGTVLMYSGAYATGATERVWDPATGAITLVPNPFYNLFCSGHSQLADGRILVVGGYDSANLGAANANLFDPLSQTWSALPNMAYRRWYPTSTTLPDGRALVTSGAQSCLTCLADTPEIFDPATGRFTTVTTARLGVPYYPFMFVLPDGKVVDAGANEDPVATSTFDPAAKTWTMVDPVVRDGHSAAMYAPGKIIKSGTAADSGTPGSAAATAFVLDMTVPSPAWRQVASMASPRAFHNTTLLPDGSVLVTGGGTMLDGYDVASSVKAAELWTPSTETWRTLAPATIPRLYHSTALLLPDGRVLTAGSGNDGPAVNQTDGEIFSPPYLFKGARPQIASAPQTAQYGSPISVQSPDAASIASISLIRPGAVTHGFDEDQRFLSLAFAASGSALSVQMPANANLAPPGYYMLFLVNTSGVPSIASFVLLTSPAADTQPPTAPLNLAGLGGIGTAALTWSASSDDSGVALYNVHRSTTSGFQPAASNRVGQTTATTFTSSGLATGAFYFVVTAQDVAGNISHPSNEAFVTVLGDATPPSVSITAPADQSAVSGSTTVTALASDDVGVVGVQFTLDGSALGAERMAPPYSLMWNTATTSNGSHTVAAVARDAAGNRSQASEYVVVSNASTNPSGLVAAYGFNEASGVQVIDASGQGNTGTISSATRTKTGRFGGALSFNGTSAWVTVADAPSLELASSLTFEAWVSPTSGNGWRSVLLKETADGLAYALYSANNASRPAAFVHTGGDVGLNGAAAVPVNAWTHLAITWDGATMRMFVNGVQVSSAAVSGAVTTGGGALRIGGNSVWGEYFKGQIDEVRIYNRALTAGEIQADMNTPVP
jgi:hypothetical protein